MENLPIDSAKRLENLRDEVRKLVPAAQRGGVRVAFGVETVDDRIMGNGLSVSALHEVAAATVGPADDASATLFVAGIAARAKAKSPVIWIVSRFDLFAPGLQQAGLPPEQLLQVEARKDEDALAVMEDALRHGGAGAVVGEITRVSMTATRRLQLAAEEGATMALLLRRWRKPGVDPLMEPSAAVTRWRIGCVPSAALPVMGIGRPRWRVSLVRQRGGEPHDWILEGCDAQGRLAVPAELGNGSATPARRQERQDIAA